MYLLNANILFTILTCIFIGNISWKFNVIRLIYGFDFVHFFMTTDNILPRLMGSFIEQNDDTLIYIVQI